MKSPRLIAISLFVLAASPLGAQDPLTAARDLYAAAAYEDALSMLNRLQAEARRQEDRPRIEQYRAYCLLALGRGSDAEQAIEAVITASPFFHPSESEASPRVRSAFTDVRRRVLPVMVQQRYTAAKQSYDNRAFAEAARGFREVLDLLRDPDVIAAADRPPLSDLRTLAAGFQELASAASAPPLPPSQPDPQPAVAPAPAPTRASAEGVARRVYSSGDDDVTAPVAIRQPLPPFPRESFQPATLPTGGVLELVISENGLVESASMRVSTTSLYDRMILNAVKEWRYRPATRLGTPVRFRKLVEIAIRQ